MPKKVFLNLHDSETDLFLAIAAENSPGKRVLGVTTGGRRLFGEKSAERFYTPEEFSKIRSGLEWFTTLLPQWQKERSSALRTLTKEVVIASDSKSPAKMTLLRTQTGAMIFIVTQNGRNFAYPAKHLPRILGAVKAAIAWLNF